MNRVLFACLITLLSCALLFAQSSSPSRVPNDLVISLKQSGHFVDSSITILSDGSWKFDSTGLPRVTPSFRGIKLAEPRLQGIKPVEPKKRKVSKDDLRWLIREFERINFLKFSSSTNPRQGSTSDLSTETILIRIDGEAKEVSNYLGDPSIRSQILANLANKIRSLTTMASNPMPLPLDFAVRFGESSVAHQRYYRVSGDGIASYYFYSNMPETSRSVFLLRGPKKQREPKLVDRLSEPRLKNLARDIEKLNFFAHHDGMLGVDDGCKNGGITLHGTAFGITIRRNGKTRTVSMDEWCNPIVGSNADAFNVLYRKLQEAVIGVKVTRLTNDQFFLTL